jgi:hypothetical protein
MITFGDQVISYYKNLSIPEVPKGVDVLYPFAEQEVIDVVSAFYSKFFSDMQDRTYLIGINPGRHGGGSTGIPFTDPQKLTDILGISHPFEGQQELSSKFMYQMIDYLGGPEAFYSSFYITSVSPVGFTKDGKNLNYYDIRDLQNLLEPYVVENLRKQITFGAKPVAYSLGMGKNIAYLQALNKKFGFFKEIKPLPHPRWIMQYRLKRLDEFLELYRKELRG